ncbi:MAG: hypothetical protein KAS23_11020 [Anaerohalosphaera sp.]|nr:hypothetical protein [Anaerohalosphaera sp.]
MEHDKLTELLTSIDKMAPEPKAVSGDLANAVRSRAAHQRRTKRVVVKVAAAFIIVVLGTWAFTAINNQIGSQQQTAGAGQSQESIAQLEAEVKQLSAKVDSLLSLVHETLAEQRNDMRLISLKSQLSAIPDPIEEMNRNIDKVAISLLYKADNIEEDYRAVEVYRRIIKLCPDNYYAEIARQKLKEIESKPGYINIIQMGDLT